MSRRDRGDVSRRLQTGGVQLFRGWRWEQAELGRVNGSLGRPWVGGALGCADGVSPRRLKPPAPTDLCRKRRLFGTAVATALHQSGLKPFTYGMLYLIDRYAVKVEQAAEERGLDADAARGDRLSWEA